MAKNKSSFHMGDEFNGSGKKTYLKATQHNKHKVSPQRNVRLTPDYRLYVPKVIGALPCIMNPAAMGVGVMLKALGGVPDITQVIVFKDERLGKYQTSFAMRKVQLTTGAYLHGSQKQTKENISIEEFIIKAASSFIVNLNQ